MGGADQSSQSTYLACLVRQLLFVLSELESFTHSVRPRIPWALVL